MSNWNCTGVFDARSWINARLFAHNLFNKTESDQQHHLTWKSKCSATFIKMCWNRFIEFTILLKWYRRQHMRQLGVLYEFFYYSVLANSEVCIVFFIQIYCTFFMNFSYCFWLHNVTQPARGWETNLKSIHIEWTHAAYFYFYSFRFVVEHLWNEISFEFGIISIGFTHPMAKYDEREHKID